MNRSIIFKNNRVFVLDQTLLPSKEVWIEPKNLAQCVEAIKHLKVRGAPLIGVFAAYAVYIALKNFAGDDREFLKRFNQVIVELKNSRPTAVNLAWALNRIKNKVQNQEFFSSKDMLYAILKEAILIHVEDINICKGIGQNGLKLIKENDSILTHCNTGFLATSGDGTALSVIFSACKKYKKIKVYNTETRPLLQGSRLTSWELLKNNIQTTLITDNMAGFLMSKGKITKIITGADRITANGDTANKIGTYSLAVLAKFHKIPFYIAAPYSTFDLSLSTGKDIPIEERHSREVREALGAKTAPEKVSVWNPAFDVTPNSLITAIITERGVVYPPFKQNIKNIFKK